MRRNLEIPIGAVTSPNYHNYECSIPRTLIITPSLQKPIGKTEFLVASKFSSNSIQQHCYETCIYFCFNIHCVTQIHVNVKCLYS